MSTTASDEEFLPTAVVARRLSWSSDSVLRAIDRGDLVALRYGRSVRISRASLEAFIASHTTSGQPRRRTG